MGHLAVLMGDIVSSSQAKSVDELHKTFNAAITSANNKFKLESPLTITLGDEFQGLCQNIASSIKIAKYIRYELLASNIACRFVVGYVKLTTPINHSSAWNMMGEGLSVARSKLNEKKQDSYFEFTLPTETHLEILLNSLTSCISRYEGQWSARQTQTILQILHDERNVAQIANLQNVTERNIYKLLQTAGMKHYQSIWNAIEETAKYVDQLNGI